VKLGKKIRYIILPIIIFASVIVTSIYYGIYKTQIIDNKIYALNEYLKNTVTKGKYDLTYARSYLQHKIDSKEASLIFAKNEQKESITSPYINQFLEQFVNEKLHSNDNINVINDFIIYDANEQLIVHINTKDPFAEPVLKKPTQSLFNDIKTSTSKKISKYYYFIDDNEEQSFNIIQVFSPYKLTSQNFYNSNDDLYIIQAEFGLTLIRNAVKELVTQHNGFVKVAFEIKKNIRVDSLSTTFSKFEPQGKNSFQAKINNELFNLTIILDEGYFSEDLNAVLMKLLLLGFLLIGTSYIVVVYFIEKQIIIPVINLAKSIKEVEASKSFELQPLNTNDEVSDLNESYISLISKINNLANNDPLTGLANRRSFTEALNSVNQLENQQNHYTSLYFIDLDNFKYVNDTYGHDIGDLLLVQFSQHLITMLEQSSADIDTLQIKSIARLGGDEFVVLLNGLPAMQDIENIGKNICALFNDDFDFGVNKFNTHASVGIAYTKVHLDSAETILNQADSAMYLAKKLGKNNYQVFSHELADKINSDSKIEKVLIETLKNDEFLLVYMPTYTAKDKILTGYEVLLRCPTCVRAGIGPDTFIPIAEQTDLILNIDLWVAENAFIKLKQLISKTGFDGFFAINVSSKSLRNDDFYTRLKALINLHNINVKQIELEITETCLMPDDQQAIHSLKKLKSLGVKIAIDDFGTGYTSFNQLVNYPLDTLKIDRTFVNSLSETPKGKKPTLDIIYELAQIYELEVIVEGVETQEDLHHVSKLPDVYVQGFYFTKPQEWQQVIEECKQTTK